jgi:predicted small lipoprotein YifL
MKRGLAALLVAVLVALSGCGLQGGDDQPPAEGATPSAVAYETPEPPTVPKEGRFTLEQTAEFDDGLQVEVAGTEATKAKKAYRGAEASNGQIVIASIRIENDTQEAYDASDVAITATYGDGTVAQPIIDPANELTSGFSGTIEIDDEAVAAVGFAIPYSELSRVSITVDCRDDLHDPVSFTGRVRKS